jgi:hypothetical protein
MGRNVKNVSASCYATLATLRKLKNILPFNICKNLVQALVPSKLYFKDIICHNLPDYLFKHLNRVQKASAGFVLGIIIQIQTFLTADWLRVVQFI